MRRKLILFLFVPVGIFAVIIIVMQLFTNSVMREIKSAFSSTDFYVEESLYDPEGNPKRYADPDVNYVTYIRDSEKPNIYARYNVTSSHIGNPSDEVNRELKLFRVFTWHNFQSGKLWFRYTIVVTDKDGNPLYGGWDIPVKLTIERENGAWEITDLYEAP